MNERIFNIAYEALQTIQEVSDILLDERINNEQTYAMAKAIQRIAITSKYMMYKEKEEADN